MRRRIKTRREERWCWCRGPDDGRPMIECMGSNCATRWFHFDCVGIKQGGKLDGLDWLCAKCEALERDGRSIVVGKIGEIVDEIALPSERCAVGEALAGAIYAVHRKASSPWRCAGRDYGIASRCAARSAVADIVDTIDPPRREVTKAERSWCAPRVVFGAEGGRGAATQRNRVLRREPPPEWFLASYRNWHEDRLLEEDLKAARLAIASAKLARYRRKRKGRRGRRGLDVGLSVHPKIPAHPPVFESGRIEAVLCYMCKREGLRARKEAEESWPWSDDWALNTFRFTNVNREDDRCTRWLREKWTSQHPDADISLIVLNCALFRSFGTVDFAEKIGWTEKVDDFLTPTLAVKAAEAVWRRGFHAFTRAYCRPYFNSEMNKVEPPIGVYAQAFAKVARLAQALLQCDKVETSSWRSLAAFIRSVKGFGGTGFVAKELVLDVMGWPSVRRLVRDDDDWTLPGPGARRGLNRLTRRELNWGVYAPAESLVEEYFIDEIRLLYRKLKQCENVPAPLTIHDVQFVLCEYDKYERVNVASGKGRSLAKYQPLEGTTFDTADGNPPESVTCRPKTAEWNVPLRASAAAKLHPPSPAVVTPSPSRKRKRVCREY